MHYCMAINDLLSIVQSHHSFIYFFYAKQWNISKTLTDLVVKLSVFVIIGRKYIIAFKWQQHITVFKYYLKILFNCDLKWVLRMDIKKCSGNMTKEKKCQENDV